MSTIAEVAPGSFDSYEGIRIVIPGLITFAAALATFKTVAPGQKIDFLDDPFIGLVAALVVGLILYFWDIPARAASYLDNQPTDFLEKEYPHVNPSELLTAYLLALNTKMPANTRNRSLYMGSMYRIGIEMILALGLASAVVFGASMFDYGVRDDSPGATSRRVAAALLLVVFVLAVLINRGYERKNADRSRSIPERLKGAISEDLRHRSMWIYWAGIALLVVPNLTVLVDRLPPVIDRGAAASGLAICVGYWIQRYIRGDALDPESPRKRRKLHSPTAGALFFAPVALSLAIYGPGTNTVLPTRGHLVGWTAVTSLVIVSIVIRGHERKLHGVYRGQTRWLKENPEAMTSVLPSPPPVASSPAPNQAEDGAPAPPAGPATAEPSP